MTAKTFTKPTFTSQLVNGLLAIKPLYNFAKSRARLMMIERAERLGVPWRDRCQQLSTMNWDSYLNPIQNLELTYPEYYLRPFHAYDQGNLSWEAAWEVESAAYAVHSGIWSDAGIKGDPKLRQSYHEILAQKIDTPPQRILDLGCSVGMSSFALQDVYPNAAIVGVDLSPYFLAVAQYNSEQQKRQITWQHAAAEATGLESHSFDLVSACLLFHELPVTAARDIFVEAARLLSPGGHFALMDMNPQSEVYAKMPPYVLTLLKSTEPYLDQYFSLDIAEILTELGFKNIAIAPNSPRHRTIVAQKS
ncbi:MAG: class I SAM-dependent methyltransferase [Jaaginema sp. PMC 1079.18]|nr:class I SAM-dependent methyltransferase [Jaaginema sp. PMC 1080.18]MEC4851705.1 class I SAM-dependent methyltransferase [Jaaginema sp. PMC 1079.18]MEC4865052.1 class I SAM-dependent methyltransferase [Jaaginema sp. PMC 1078.18]